MRPSPLPRTTPPASPAALRTPAHPDAPGLPGKRRRRGGSERQSWRLAERGAGATGSPGQSYPRDGAAPRGPGSGGSDCLARLSHAKRRRGGAGRAPGGGACHHSALLSAFLRVSSSRDATLGTAATGPASRRGQGGAAGAVRPPSARAAGPSDAPPGRSQKRPNFAARALARRGAKSLGCASFPVLFANFARLLRCPRPSAGERGQQSRGTVRPARPGWAGMGRGPSGAGEPGPAARARERRL